MRFYRNERGQILLIVVLVIVVALTVGLSVVSRTITNLKISKENEESQRAFQAAEAGIERALNEIDSLQSGGSTQSTLFDDLENNSSFTTDINLVSGTSFLLNGGEDVVQAVGADVWLSRYPNYTNTIASNTISIYWATSDQFRCASGGGTSTTPALEVLVLSDDISDPTLQKYVFDSCARIPGSDSSPSAGGNIDGVQFSYRETFTVTNGLIMKVIPIYNSGVIGIQSSVALPSQGSLIESTGESGETVRKVVYFQSYPQIPVEIFPYSILSQ